MQFDAVFVFLEAYYLILSFFMDMNHSNPTNFVIYDYPYVEADNRLYLAQAYPLGTVNRMTILGPAFARGLWNPNFLI